jgi:hypothetical protein
MDPDRIHTTSVRKLRYTLIEACSRRLIETQLLPRADPI